MSCHATIQMSVNLTVFKMDLAAGKLGALRDDTNNGCVGDYW